MSKLGTVCKDVSIYFLLDMAIQTLSTLYRKKKPYLYSLIGVWLKIALAILIYNITS